MKAAKIREKYSNIKSEEDFEKLHTMLKYKNYKIITLFFDLLLLVCSGFLYEVNFIIAVICLIASVVIWWTASSRWDKYIDEFFLATVSRKKVDKRVILSQESLRKALKKYTVKELGSDFFVSELVGLLCMMVWGFILMFLGKDDGEIPLLIFFVIIPLVAFGVLRIGAILKRIKTKNSPYILLRTKIIDRKAISSSDPESNSESYYFVFNCGNYGVIDYGVSHRCYHSAFVGVDEYYLVIVKRRFSNGYKIVDIFSAEEYELSPALEKMLG